MRHLCNHGITVSLPSDTHVLLQSPLMSGKVHVGSVFAPDVSLEAKLNVVISRNLDSNANDDDLREVLKLSPR